MEDLLYLSDFLMVILIRFWLLLMDISATQVIA